MKRLIRIFFILTFGLGSTSAVAQNEPLQIDITQGVERGYPVAVVPFETSGVEPPHSVSDIVEADLGRSGRFEPLPQEDFLNQPHDHTEVNYKDWRLIQAEWLVVGRVQDVGGDRYKVQFQLFDVFKSSQVAGFFYTVSGRQLRKLAHQISDLIYEKVTGQKGAFDTRIAYVTVSRQEDGSARHLLRVADSDGYGPKTILQSKESIMSPAWSPDSTHLAYVSFENGRSMVYIQRLSDGTRNRVAEFQGINSAPAWSPEGRRLAMALSRDGNPEIYVLDVSNRQLERLTRHLGIDTEPAWSPDGRQIVFTSDRSGKPQIYRMNADGTGVQRVTFEGTYNARASYAADGQRLTLVTNQGSGFRIGVYNMNSGATRILTDSSLDESPSFAPNGQMILYATKAGGKGVLAAVSADGRVKQVLKFLQGDVREPAWSPFNRKL
ncbi:MAG: Tol-Pal system beta propeller repeat protein TolB [Gammaproteobacteria bacterium]|nr:Tol-Pal system beta propeller repeat protein TolB [Gammaproteobacteria bacterium]